MVLGSVGIPVGKQHFNFRTWRMDVLSALQSFPRGNGTTLHSVNRSLQTKWNGERESTSSKTVSVPAITGPCFGMCGKLLGGMLKIKALQYNNC
jgi:hypothetical protein